MKANDIPPKNELGDKSNNKMNKAKAFKDLRIMNPNYDAFKPFDPTKILEQDNKIWESGFTPTTKIPYNFYGDCSSVQKLNNQMPFNNDSMRSPDCKFFFNPLYNFSATPTPLRQNTPFNHEKNFFQGHTPGQTPGQTPGRTPGLSINSVGMSPNISFGKEQRGGNCFFFPQPANQIIKDVPQKDNITFGSNEESFGAVCNIPRNVVSKPIVNIPSTPSPPPKEEKKKIEKKPKKSNRTTKRKNLSIREDVMNKNIFRAFKRELKNIYNSFIGESALAEDKDVYKSKFIQTVSNFTETMIQDANFDKSIYKGFDLQVCKTFIGIFLDYCFMKKSLKSTEDKERLSSSFKVIYSYSHQKFYEFLCIPEIKIIFRAIISKTGIEHFLANHDSLGKEKYRTHINTIMERLQAP